MVVKLADRVSESAQATGTGSFTLGGPSETQYIAFSTAFTTGDLISYVAVQGEKWEIGTGTLLSETQLSRDFVWNTSDQTGINSQNIPGSSLTKISFDSGTTITIFVGLPSHLVLALDENGDLLDPTPFRNVVFIETLTDMKALTGLSDGETVVVTEDEVGGIFKWDATDSTSADNVDTFRNDNSSGVGLHKRVSIRVQASFNGSLTVDAAADGDSYIDLFTAKKASNATKYFRWFTDAANNAVRLASRLNQGSLTNFLSVYSTGDNADRVAFDKPSVLATRSDAQGIKSKTLAWLSGVSRLVMATADAANNTTEAAYKEIPLTKGGFIVSDVIDIYALKQIDPVVAGFSDGDRAVARGSNTASGNSTNGNSGNTKVLIYYWSSTSSATADDINVVRPSVGAAATGNGRWLILASDITATMTSGDATPSVRGIEWLITAGTTAITDFNDAYEGQLLTVQRASADITITHDPTKIDLGGADVTLTAASPRLTLRSQGGVWRSIVTPSVENTINSSHTTTAPSGQAVQAALDLKASLAALAASSGSSLVSFIRSDTGAISLSLQTKLRQSRHVDDFGATGTGSVVALSTVYGTLGAAQAVYPFVTSLTQSLDYAAIQAAINAGSGVVNLGPKVYHLGGDVLSITGTNIILQGEGKLCTDIKSSTTTDHIIGVGDGTANPVNVFICDMAITATATQTAGGALRFQNHHSCGWKNVQVYTQNVFNAITIDGGAQQYFTYGEGHELKASNACIAVGTNGSAPRNTYIGKGSGSGSALYGVLVGYASGGWIIDNEYLSNSYALKVAPDTGETANFWFVSGTWGDTNAQDAFSFTPANTGKIYGWTFVNSWASSAVAGSGLVIDQGSGVVDGIIFTNGRAWNNHHNFADIVAASNVTISHTDSYSNSVTSSAGWSDIKIGASTNHVTVAHNKLAGIGTLGFNRTGWGVEVVDGATNYKITFNSIMNPVRGGVLDGGSTTKKWLLGNTNSWNDYLPVDPIPVKPNYVRRNYVTATAWKSRTSAEDNSWRSVCYAPELARFCAVAIDGTNRVMTSDDGGVTWTVRTAAAANQWNSVCWSPELSLFCAVADSGTNTRVMTSPDGITWTTRTNPTDSGWISVCWAAEISLFVAVAQAGGTSRAMTSPDGVTWTTRTTPSNIWLSVCWSKELHLFCAVAYDGTANGVMTSYDGITWTARVPATDVHWSSVCWSPQLKLFAACASNGATTAVMTSPDGITWTSRTTVNQTWYGICWAPEVGLFCAVASSGTGTRVMTSPDGITWTTRTSGANNGWRAVCWAAQWGLFCSVGESGTATRVQTSVSMFALTYPS